MDGDLSLDRLRILVAIADAGSFSAAGRLLGRAQSAISQAVATLEARQGVELFDRSGYRPQMTEAGRVLVEQARLVLGSASRFEAVAAAVRGGLEAELALAIDPLVPSGPLVHSLRRLNEKYPGLQVSFATEGLGGALHRLRNDSAALAICILLPTVPEDVIAHPLMRITMRPVVAPNHPLASLGRPASPDDLAPHVQLVLSDPVKPDSPDYGIFSSHRWRFVDLGRRMDFLRAGLGWCRMPAHVVDELIRDGLLVSLSLEHDPTPPEGPWIYAAHRRDRSLGTAARWLMDSLRESLES